MLGLGLKMDRGDIWWYLILSHWLSLINHMGLSQHSIPSNLHVSTLSELRWHWHAISRCTDTALWYCIFLQFPSEGNLSIPFCVDVRRLIEPQVDSVVAWNSLFFFESLAWIGWREFSTMGVTQNGSGGNIAVTRYGDDNITMIYWCTFFCAGNGTHFL